MASSKIYSGLKQDFTSHLDLDNRPRIYFCCHPDDFKTTFPRIKKLIFSIKPQVIFCYVDPKESISEETEDTYLSDIQNTQLFVVPVTPNLLYKESRAKSLEIDFAKQKHIPILPLLNDTELFDDFNKTFDNLHCIQENDTNDPSSECVKKIDNFLNDIFITDELEEKVRNAFDCTIFLSYRKKDKKYARDIIRTIHELPACRDIAIWYDEYLKPGQDFAKGIAEAMGKSKIMLLTITPNLLEDNNYIIKTEYPLSRKMNLQTIPIMALDTDAKKVQSKFKELPQIINLSDKNTLSVLLEDYLIDYIRTDNKDNSEQLFLMGIAYLKGILVENNIEFAETLISKAADKNHLEALKTIISMYKNGDGVSRNYEKTISYQKKLIDLLKDSDSAKEYISQCVNLAGFFQIAGNDNEALVYYQYANEAAKELFEGTPSPENKSKLADTYSNITTTLNDLERTDEALVYNDKAIKLKESLLNSEEITENIVFNLFSSYLNHAKILRTQLHFDDAISWFQKSIDLLETNIKDKNHLMKARKIALANLYIGSTYSQQRMMSEAELYYNKVLASREAICKASPTPEDLRDYASINQNIAYIKSQHLNFKESRTYCLKAIEINKKILKEKPTINNLNNLINGYNQFASTCNKDGDIKNAIKYYKLGISMLEDSKMLKDTILGKRKLSNISGRLGTILLKEGKLSEARRYAKQYLALSEEIYNFSPTTDNLNGVDVAYNLMGLICRDAGDWDKANTYFLKQLDLHNNLISTKNSIHIRTELGTNYSNLGRVAEGLEKYEEAEKYFTKSLEIRDAIAKESDSAQDHINIATTYNCLGRINWKQNKTDLAEEWFKKELLIREELADQSQSIKEKAALCTCKNYLADIEKLKGNLDEAKKIYTKILKTREELQNSSPSNEILRDLGSSYYSLAKFYCDSGNKKNALNYAQKCLTVRQKLDKQSQNINEKINIKEIQELMQKIKLM